MNKQDRQTIEVYKVVLQVEGRLFSTSGVAFWEVEYGIGLRSVPFKSYAPLMAFSSLEDAQVFFGRPEFPYAVYRAIAQRSRVSVRELSETSKPWAYTSLWRGALGPFDKMPVPEGTVFCDWIELAERIE